MTAAIVAKTTVRAETQIAPRTKPGLAWALVRATIEVALVARVRITAAQPRLVSSEVST